MKNRSYEYRKHKEEVYKKRHIELLEARSYPAPYYYKKYEKDNGEIIEVLKEAHLGKRYTKLKRKIANKKVRKYKGYISDGGEYKHLYSLWFETF